MWEYGNLHNKKITSQIISLLLITKPLKKRKRSTTPVSCCKNWCTQSFLFIKNDWVHQFLQQLKGVVLRFLFFRAKSVNWVISITIYRNSWKWIYYLNITLQESLIVETADLGSQLLCLTNIFLLYNWKNCIYMICIDYVNKKMFTFIIILFGKLWSPSRI